MAQCPRVPVTQIGRSSGLNSRFPLWIVLSAPQFHGIIVTDDVTILGIAGESPSRSLGNIPQVAQHGTAMTLGDFGVEFQWFIGTNGSQEIIDMFDISA
mgnify:CR=1 FL=1